jgi:O-antigen ligase
MELPTPKRDQLLQQLLMGLACAIPWAKKALPTLIGIVVLLALIRLIRRKTWSIPSHPTAPVALLTLFLLLIAGTIYSQHPENGWNEIGIKFSFLLFPLLSLFTPTLAQDDVKKIHHWFVAGCFLFIGITVIHAGLVVYQHPDWYYFTYDRLSWYIHPTYAATYQAMALFILLHSGIKNNLLTGRKWVHVLAIILVLGFIALLSSKAGYLCALLVIAYSMYVAYQHGNRIGRIAAQAVLAVALFITTILVLPTSSDRVKDAVADIRQSEHSETNSDSTVAEHTSSTSMRLITWSASWSLLCENPFGTGTGDTQPQLNTLYEQKGEHYAALRQFNAHNQFLQTGAEIGWPGLAALLIILVAVWIIGRSEPTAQLFVWLCALNFLFESFLEVQAGIVFFSFWILVYSRTERRGL